ncbi:hypothetical protein SAMD00023353_3600110 [Rosellinia necatrix]|uniref:Uncharacterized protein n=1 Tax=Rosellinia necatrix TaxID=77044 RepID=A0A1S8A8U6_ROSNE|nr:hypothetical protein SAMD00023353_3600110 [Rosellinia necatrix]
MEQVEDPVVPVLQDPAGSTVCRSLEIAAGVCGQTYSARVQDGALTAQHGTGDE